MSAWVWSLAALAAGTAVVGALCNAILRNALAAIPASIVCSGLLWWYFTARSDPMWPIAAVVVVPVIVFVSMTMGMLGHAARRVDGDA
jgi:uncharacterized membrane protein YoaK (UPF0700 family)